MHDLLFFAHTMCVDYVTKRFLLASSSGIAELPRKKEQS